MSGGGLLLFKNEAGKVASAKGKLECLFLTHSQHLKQSKGELLSQEAMQGHSANGSSPAMPKSLFFLNNSTLPSNKTRLVPSGKLPGKIDQQKSDVFLNLGTWNISL